MTIFKRLGTPAEMIVAFRSAKVAALRTTRGDDAPSTDLIVTESTATDSTMSDSAALVRVRDTGRQAGFTLLELMLALTLAAMIMVTISMAIDLHLRVLDSRRNHCERIQLARAVLGMVATDLRSTVQQSTTDFSALAAMASEALASGVVDEAVGDTSGGESSGESTGGSSSGGISGGGTSGGGTSGGGTSGGGSTPSGSGSSSGSRSGSPSGSSPSGSSPSGSSPSGSSSTGGSGTSGGTTGGTSGGTSGGMSGGTGSTGTGGTSGTADGAESESTASEDIASTEAVPPVPGLYGNQYELQIDVSRLPRVDELQRMNSNSLTNSLQDIPSDVKTVAYYCVGNGLTSSSGVVNPRTGKTETGLVRRVMDRAVTLYASESGNLQGLQQAAEVIAPEVAGIEFQYYDGTEWLTEWNSDEMCCLPTAVRITVVLTERAEADGTNQAYNSTLPTMATASADQIYSLMVRLPTAKPAATSTEDASGMESLGL
jgi:prepilin-type N-terminal cleavage/methylation domain-containing protein